MEDSIERACKALHDWAIVLSERHGVEVPSKSWSELEDAERKLRIAAFQAVLREGLILTPGQRGPVPPQSDSPV